MLTKMIKGTRVISAEGLMRVAQETKKGFEEEYGDSEEESEEEEEEYSERTAQVDDSPKVYVGTYNKYNQGNLEGEWVDLSQFDSAEEFYNYIKSLHSDESDPEFMFQDYENIPDAFINESYISPVFFELKNRIDDYNMDAFMSYSNTYFPGGIDENNLEEVIDQFEEAYSGDYESMVDYAYAYIDDMGGVVEAVGPEGVASYFDEEAFMRDLEAEGWRYMDEETANQYPDEAAEGPGVYDPSGEFYGDYSSLSELVDSWVDDGSIIDYANYFDYEQFARDLEYDYDLVDGHLFRRI